MYRILVTDPLEATGLAMLRESGHDVHEVTAEEKARLEEIVGDYDAMVVRSGTQVTADLLRAGKNLRVVGRAGIGVDNVDVETATELGILVVNAPTANQLSATEHTFALMLALARNVALADADIKSGQWNRKKFVGAELQGKKLGVIGFGRIGRQVARRARAFDMSILAYDPFLDADMVRRENAEARTLDALLEEADVLTLHVPLTDDTRNLLNAERVAKIKPGALLVNCARGGVVDEDALLKALDEGRVAGAGLDVFAVEPPEDYTLARHPRVVATPHLGAQTREAQVRISTDTAKMVVRALEGSLAVTAVNLPFRPAGNSGEPYLRLAEKLGMLASTLLVGAPDRLTVTFNAIEDSLVDSMTVAAVRGCLSRYLGVAVNYVNAERSAVERGIEVVKAQSGEATSFPNLVTLELSGDDGQVTIAGTLFHGHEPRVVRVDDYQVSFLPKADLLVVRNQDVPGVVGQLGTLLGDAAINIAEIHLARQPKSDQALAVIRVDQEPSAEVLEAVRALEPVRTASAVDVGPI